MASARVTKSFWAQAADNIREQCDAVTELYAGQIEASAAIAAPYEFGTLRESIAVEGASLGAALARRRIVVGVHYGIYQHEGTSGRTSKRIGRGGKVESSSSGGIDGNPFLADAVEYWRADYLAAIRLVVTGGG